MSTGRRPHGSSGEPVRLGSFIAGMVTFDLFVDCVIPGCRNPVNGTDDVCNPCRVAFGPYLTISADRAPLAEAEIADRHGAVRGAYRQQRADTATDHDESKANQVCWSCGQRRTCTHRPHGWECRRCQGLT